MVGAGTPKVEGAAHAQGERRARQGRGANALPRSGRCPPRPGKDTAPFQVLLNWKPQDEEDEEEEDRLGRKTAHVEAQGCETAWRAVKVLKHEGGSKAARVRRAGGRSSHEPRVCCRNTPPTHTHTRSHGGVTWLRAGHGWQHTTGYDLLEASGERDPQPHGQREADFPPERSPPAQAASSSTGPALGTPTRPRSASARPFRREAQYSGWKYVTDTKRLQSAGRDDGDASSLAGEGYCAL